MPRQMECCRPQVTRSIMAYRTLRHHTAQLSGISSQKLDMADMFFILSRYLCDLEHFYIK